MKKITLILSLVVLMIGMVFPALADEGTASISIEGGQLSVLPEPVIFEDVTLNGLDQTTNGESADKWVAIDPTGTGGGWHVTISTTDFVNITPGFEGKTIDLSQGTGLRMAIPQDNIAAVYGNAVPSTLIEDFTSVTSEARTILSAAENEGMGEYEFEPLFDLFVPAETYKGTYEATFTVTITAGP